MGPSVGFTDTRHSGTSVGAARPSRSRIVVHKLREISASWIAAAPKSASARASRLARSATESAKPSILRVRARRVAVGGRPVGGARHREGRAQRRRHGHHRAIVGEAGKRQRRLRLRGGQHLEGDLGEHGERPVGAGERLHQVVAGDVLHHPSAGAHHGARPGDGAHADQAVARRAQLDAARAGEVGGGDRPDGRRAGGTVKGAMIGRLEGEALVVFGERRLDLGERRAGARRKHQFGRLVEGDAGEAGGRQSLGDLHGPPEAGAGAAAGHPQRRRLCRGVGHGSGQLFLVGGGQHRPAPGVILTRPAAPARNTCRGSTAR